MSRVAGSYPSVVRGVSEQVPQDRRPGQHYEQINMISDPVKGLARRHGSLNLHETVLRAYTPVDFATTIGDTKNHKVFQFRSNSGEYDLLYRTEKATVQFAADALMCADIHSGRYIDVVYAPGVDQHLIGGVSAVANVGAYLLIAGNTMRATTTQTNYVAATENTFVAWVRGGAYARTYKVILNFADGGSRTYSYTTPTTAYPGILDTSDISATDPEYSKKVNDRVNAYNTAATQWIGTAAAAIVPSAIAEQLRLLIAADGLVVTRNDSTVIVYDNLGGNKILSIAVEDGGDGTLFLGVGNEVSAVERVSTIHEVGKTIRVRPKRNDGTDVFYLRAYRANNATSGARFSEVTWREAAGLETQIVRPWLVAKVHTDGKLYVALDAAQLTSLGLGAAPGIAVNGVGDLVSSPLPYFVGKRIDYLGVFQDRLVIASGSVLYFSRTGDYQNLWRQSILTVDAADPIEMYALGAEDDVISSATTYDRNLLLFGRKHQYVVSGRQPLTPLNASVVIQSSHEDAVDADPINSGNFVFYNKYRNGVSSMHQVQIGQLADSPESYEVSSQLDRYLIGRPRELLALTAPNMVFMRTDTERQTLYVYTYLDSPGGAERQFDAWSKWRWHEAVGHIMGLSKYQSDLLVYTIKHDGVNIYKAIERFVVDTVRSDRPYMDSLRLENQVGSSITDANVFKEAASTVYGITDSKFLLGSPWARRDELDEAYPDSSGARWAGWEYTACVTPTNPYIMDSNGKAVINGRLTIMSFAVSVVDTGGLTATITTPNGTKEVTNFTGRIIGRDTNLIGKAPVVSTSVPVPAGRETREFTYTLKANNWLPLTVTAIEWRGQFFSNIRRI